jgi:muramoyltetrapeptide carboxypeptidase
MSRRLILPSALRPGDTIGMCAPASAPPDPKAIDRGAAVLESLGFKVKLAPAVRQRRGYLAGNDRDRASDLMSLFADKKVHGIICVRGGYGAARLLPRLDYNLVRANPKVFVGYSDITSLHCAFLKMAGLVTFHGPMLSSDLIVENLPQFTTRSLLRAVAPEHPATDAALMPFSTGYRRNTVKALRRGVARGRLIGGNLTILCTLPGTPWLPSFRNAILFLEDLSEKPFRFDRMLTFLSNCGLLQQVAGVAIGLNAECEDPKAGRGVEYRQSLEDVLRERLLPLKVPVLSGLPFGHVPHNGTLPFGTEAVLDAGRGELFVQRSVL